MPPTDPTLDDAPAGFLTVDASGTIRRANATLASMLGRARDELEGAHVDAILAPAGRIFFSTHVFPLLRVQRLAEEIYLPMRTADSVDLPMLLNGRAREGGGEELYDLVIVPMRQRTTLESELLGARKVAEEAADAKDRFISMLTHELRSPLAGMMGYADLLLRGSRGELTDDQRAYVERIRQAAEYQATLIDDILDFAASGTDRTLMPIAVGLEEVLERAEAILTVRAEQASRPLERTPRPAPGRVRADPRAVQQVLLNLGVNALKYGAPETPVRIDAEAGAERARISVSDEGEGIAPEHLERIFEPFVRLATADEGRVRGVGLGLAISRDLARRMGGDLTVSSTLGVGSTFVLELPAG